MGGVKRALRAVRERWPQIVLACVILVFVFGLGMYVQSRRAVAEDDLYSAA